ncbi:MAG: hypothetical protein K2H35_01080 [Muribaculaceae bacterium]|nr:hypothetical protein [Muribaculaceae bacterium]MDE6558459.1 hypothetical protein [Muribaculaceae bacterium]
MKVSKSIILLLIAFAGVFGAFSQTLEVGVAKTRYIYAGTTLKNHYGIFLSESLSSESLKNQQIELAGAYFGNISKFYYNAGFRAGTAWCGSYQRYAAFVNLAYHPFNRWMIAAKLMPNYDTGYRYHTDWSAGIRFNAFKPLWINLDFSTIPDYRKSEKRLHLEAAFNVSALSASVAVSMPVEGDSKFRTLRILMGLNYRFDFSKSTVKTPYNPLRLTENL